MLFHAVSPAYNACNGYNAMDWQNWINKCSSITSEHLLGYLLCSLSPGRTLQWSWNIFDSKLEPKPLKFLLPPIPTVCLCVHFLVEVYLSTVSVPPHASPLNSHRSTCFPPPLLNCSRHQKCQWFIILRQGCRPRRHPVPECSPIISVCSDVETRDLRQ